MWFHSRDYVPLQLKLWTSQSIATHLCKTRQIGVHNFVQSGLHKVVQTTGAQYREKGLTLACREV